MRFAKGHGTENDFVILPDPEGELQLTKETVRLLCDRRAGIGGDGILRVVRTRALGETLAPAARTAERPEWFMDYRNSDGSVAEMCGNGVRVFAHYLRHAGLVEGDRFEVGTRDGAKGVVVEADGDITVDMGRVEMQGTSSAKLARQAVHGSQISVGNPHLACEVQGPVADVDLSEPPELDAEAFPEGANVEVYTEVAPVYWRCACTSAAPARPAPAGPASSRPPPRPPPRGRSPPGGCVCSAASAPSTWTPPGPG